MSHMIVEERKYMTHVPYASVVGSLMYVMLCTKPDLSQSVSIISKYSTIPVGVIGRQ